LPGGLLLLLNFWAMPAVAAPANDLFGQRSVLVGDNLTQSVELTGASLEAGEPQHLPLSSGLQVTGSVWYEWTAPNTGTLFVSGRAGARPGTVVIVYLGNQLATLQPVGFAIPDQFGHIAVQAGETYVLAVADTGLGGGEAAVSIQLLPRPANDDFADRSLLEGLPVKWEGSLANATLENGESRPDVASVWWRWLAPISGQVVLWIPEATTLVNASVFTGTSLPSLIPLASLRSDRDNVQFPAVAGTEYAISLADGSSGPLRRRATLQLLGKPANDDLAAAGQISGMEAEEDSWTYLATAEATELISQLGSGRTVWWQWTAPANGRLALSSSSFGQIMSLFRRSADGTLAQVLPMPAMIPQARPEGWPVDAHTTYYIQADDLKWFPGGSFALRLRLCSLALTGVTNGGVYLQGEVPPIGIAGLESEPAVEGGARLQVTARAIGSSVGAAFEVTNSLPFSPEIPAGYRELLPRWLFPDGATINGMPTTVRIRPVNDDFSQAILLEGESVSLRAVQPTGGDNEPGEPALPEPSLGSIWWRWTAPRAGRIRLEATQGLEVFRGAALERLVPVASMPPPGFPLTFAVESGEPISIRLRDLSPVNPQTAPTLETLHWDYAAENDLFADSLVLAGMDAAFSGTLWGAAAEPEELAQDSGDLRSVWWRWTAPADGMAVVELDAGGQPCLQARLWEGDGLASLVSPETSVTVSPPDVLEVAYRVAAGKEYRLAVFCRASSDAGRFSGRIRWQPLPVNDAFDQRIQLAGESVELVGTGHFSTREAGENVPLWFNRETAQTIWWSWTALRSGLATITGALSLAGVLRGDSLHALDLVAGQTIRDGWAFPVVQGETYQICLGGSTRGHAPWAGGRIKAPQPPPNDSKPNAERLTGAEVNFWANNLNATWEPGEPGEPGQGRAVWFRWRPPGNGSVWVLRPYVESQIRGYREVAGGELAPLVPLPEAPRHSGFPVEEGVDFVFALELGHETESSVWLGWKPMPPVNDDFGQPLALAGTSLRVTGSGISSTFGPGETEPSVWYRWTAPASGRASFLDISPGTRHLTLFQGEDSSRLFLVAQAAGHLSCEVSGGRTYRLRVGTADDFSLLIELTPTNPQPLRLAFKWGAMRELGLQLYGREGEAVEIQSSDDMSRWTREALLTPPPWETQATLWLPSTAPGERFFRAVPLR